MTWSTLMGVKRLSASDFTVLENPGIRSEQIIWPRNAPGAMITMTRVTMEPGSITPHHSHPKSEQTWIIEKGTATLLLGLGRTAEMTVGDVIRTPPGEVHGISNTGAEAFVYLTVTTPPIDLTTSYDTVEKK